MRLARRFDPASPDYWLSWQRVHEAARVFVVSYVVTLSLLAVIAILGLEPRPVGSDYLAFWSASHLVLTADPAAAYEFERMLEAHQVAVPGTTVTLPWLYPPTYLLLVTPLALLSYYPGLLIWLIASGAAYALVIRRIVPRPGVLVMFLALPAALLNVMHGQNAFLVGALLGGALLLVERRPLLAGVLIGCLTIKPHLGVLIPVALLCGGHWRVLLAASLTTIGLALLSAAILGGDVWPAFLGNGDTLRLAIHGNPTILGKMPTLFSTLALAGAPLPVAYALQGAFGVALAVVVGFGWRRGGPLGPRAALLAAGALLAVPYIVEYDLALLAIPIAFLVREALRTGWLRHERGILVAVAVSPFLTEALAMHLQLQLGPLFLLALFWLAARRVFTSAADAAGRA